MKFSLSYGRGLVRFVHMFNYPEGVSAQEGDRWYFEEHVPAVKALPGIVRFKTWKALEPIAMWTFDPYDRFTRMTELVFENMELCLNGTVRNPGLWAAGSGSLGFRELECIMLDEEPQYDLLRDVPVQQYKYAAVPPKYTPGKMMEDDSDDVILDVYMFNYSEKFTLTEGEDWYLGHHTREGRITKQLGNKHYQTWKSLKTAEEENSTLRPNRFYRLTELGLPAYAMGKGMPAVGERPAMLAYTQSPFGRAIGEWRNILINPDEALDLLK